MRTSTLPRMSLHGREQDEHGDEERRDRVALRPAGAGEQQPDSTAVEPARSLAKWSAFEASAGLR